MFIHNLVSYKLIYCFFIIFSSLLYTSPESAEAPLITVESALSKAVITIGDRILYKVTVKRPENLEVHLPALGLNLGEFEIRDYDKITSKRDKQGFVTDEHAFDISTFTTGDYVIPPVNLFYFDRDSLRHEISTDILQIKVNPVSAGDTTDLVGLKAQVYLKSRYRIYYWLFGSGFVLILSSLFLIRWWLRKKKLSLPQSANSPVLPADQLAIQSLDALKEENLLEKGQLKLFYFRISEIIRIYFGNRYEFNAVDLTTEELILKLNSSRLKEKEEQLIYSFLGHTDLVKFAKYQPIPVEYHNTLQSAYDIIELTRVSLKLPESVTPSSTLEGEKLKLPMPVKD